MVIASAIIDGAAGVVVSLGGLDTTFTRVGLRSTAHETHPTARRVTTFLKDEWQVPLPELLVAAADRGAGLHLERLGIGSPSQVPNEAVEHARLAPRRLPRKGVRGPDKRGEFTTVALPDPPGALRQAVEEVLERRYGVAEADDDGDYPAGALGTRFYVSILEDRPVIRIWKTVVRGVRSRRSAVIEANYLNRTHPLTRWVLWSGDLVQEVYLPAAPFVPSQFDEMLERFTEQYGETVSALTMRLDPEA